MVEGKSKSGGVPMRLVLGLLLWLAAAVCAGVSLPAMAQVQVSPISDTVYYANGTAAAGTVLVSWPAFTTASGQSVPKGSTSVTLGVGGKLNVSLAPNAGATPAGTYYTVVYHLGDGSTSREYWAVPVSTGTLSLGAVRSNALPAAVAIQTVSKQYVDQAIARAALGAVPQDTSAYVLKSGDTMTGALTLPGDPVAALQAATKNYVDSSVAAGQGGLSQKVSTAPAATQTVTQPSGTQLQVNNLNGQLYAKQYQTQGNSNGITTALTSPDCASGCSVVADPAYTGSDQFTLQASHSRLTDQRGGAVDESFFNPQSPNQSLQTGRTMTINETTSAAGQGAAGKGTLQSAGIVVTERALAGGNNLYPGNFTSSIPYFKSTYGTSQTNGYNATVGQHVLDTHVQNCYAIGDCLIGSEFLYSSGGFRDNSDEGTHPKDLVVAEHTSVFRGTCALGCSTGSTHVQITATADAGTQGEGRFLIDKTPGKVITTGTLTGGSPGAPHASAQFSGTSFPVSTFFTLADAAVPQANNMAPGTISAAIVTSGVLAGYSTNTAAAPAASGVACLADANYEAADNFETVNYTVQDGTHLQLTLNKPHAAGTTIAIGGLCGYGLEQTVDTTNNLRQVFPVIGSLSGSSLYYAGLFTRVVGRTGATSGYANIQNPLTTLQRSGNVVTATVSGTLPQDINGLTVTIAGVADSSYNGTFPVTTTAANQFTYTQAGANSTSTGGSVSVITGGFALYPMAEVLSVFNPATKAVDGAMTLAPNAVAWSAGDAVEQPHYFQSRVAADVTAVYQYLPRPTQPVSAGVQYNGLNSSVNQGWVISNTTPANAYFGNGGTHVVPQVGMAVQGAWGSSLDLQAGDSNGILMRCNSHGCGQWNSAYNLFALQSSAYYDYINFAPSTSTLTFNMRGTQYSLSPTSLTAPVINATTINATRINGLQTATSSIVGGVTLGPSATSAALANVASSGSAADLSGLAPSATVDTTNAANVKRSLASMTPNVGSFPISVPATTVFCFDGDSTSAGVPAAGTSAISTIFVKTPIGAAVAANGATHIANYAVAGQNLATINARYSTSCHNVRPGATLGDGTVVGTAYFVFWSYWNNEAFAGFTNVAGTVNRVQQEYAMAKADGFIVVGATAMQDPSQAAGTEYLRQQYNAQLRALKSFYNTTTVSACVAANVCGYDYLNDLDALIPDLKQPFQTNADGVTISYPLVGSDGRHPSDTAAYLEMYNLNSVLLHGADTLPKGTVKPYGEVTSTSATAAIPPFATLATITLAANYSPAWAAPPNPNSAPRECVQFIQAASGGPYTVTWPSTVLGGFTVGTTASKRSQQCFAWSISQAAWVAESNGITNY